MPRYDIDPNDIQLLDPLPSGSSDYPAKQLPDPFRDYPPDPTDIYHKGIGLRGAAVQRPQVILPRLFTGSDEPAGLLAPGHFDLNDPVNFYGDPYKLEEGGVTVLLPKGINGLKINPDEAIKYYKSTGQHLGIFKDEESADAYRKGLTEWQKAGTPGGYGLDVTGEDRFGIPKRMDTRTGRKDLPEISYDPSRPVEEQVNVMERGAIPIEPQESLKRKDRQVGMVEPPNIDLDNLTPAETPGGGMETLAPIAVTDFKKKQTVLIPTVIDGKLFPAKDAIRDYKKTGKHLGIFKSDLAAGEYRNQLMERQGMFYGTDVPTQMADDGSNPAQLAPGGGMPFDTYPSQADTPDVTSNRGLLASTAGGLDTYMGKNYMPSPDKGVPFASYLKDTVKGVPIPPPSQEESDRLIEAEQINKTPEDRINVPELDQPKIDPKDIQLLPRGDEEIHLIDPKDIQLLPPQGPQIDPKDIQIRPSTSLMQRVKGYEGWDTGGWDYNQYSTGYGTKAKFPGEQISKEEADRRLEDELTGHARNVDAAIEKSGMKLDPNQREALISFDYNTGKGAELINTSANPEEILRRMVQYNKAGGQTLPSLVERRQDEAAWFNGGTPPIRPDQAPAGGGPETPSAFARMAGGGGKPVEQTYDPAEVAREAKNQALRGIPGSVLGLGQAASQYVFKPILGGTVSAVKTLAPDSNLANFADTIYEDFNKTFGEETTKVREELRPKTTDTALNQVSYEIGAMAIDLPTMAATGGGIQTAKGAMAIGKAVVPEAAELAPTIFNIVKQHIPGLTEAAASMSIPALRNGMDAAETAAKMGQGPVNQNLAFQKAAFYTMASAMIPMNINSSAQNMFNRLVSRMIKAAPVAAATTAAMNPELLNDPRQLAINSIPVIMMASALGKHVQKAPKGPVATKAVGPEKTPSMPGGEITLAPRATPAGDERFAPPGLRPEGQIGAPATGPPEVIPPRTPGMEEQPPPEIPTGPSPRIKPVIGTVKKAKGGKISLRWPFPIEGDAMRFMQGTAEIFEKSGFPALGQAVRNHMDQFRVYMAKTGAPIRKWAKGITGAQMKTAHEEFKNYWQSMDERWQAISNAMGGLEDRPETPKLGDKRFAPSEAPRSGLGAQVASAENQLSALAGKGGDFISQLRAKKDELGWDDQTYLNRMRQAIDRVTGQTREEPAGLPGPAAGPPTVTYPPGPGLLPSGPTPSQAIYNAASPKGKELIDLWERLGDETGDMAVKNKLEVFDHETKTWRPFRKIGGGRFFPRRLDPYWIEVLGKPEQYPEAYAEIKREILAKGYVNQLSEVDAYLKRALKQHTPNDLSPLEHARTSPLPTRVYDYSFDQALNYLRNFSWDMARIEAFGQKHHGDLFDQAQQSTSNTYDKNYISWVQDIAYRKQAKEPFFGAINLATNVSTWTMLGNYLSSMRNAIGGVLYNAQYNGVLSASKALLQVHKWAGAIDDAYELGVLQDNLHNLQQDVHNLSPGQQKWTGGILKWAGYQKVEEVTRAMNLLSARDFLRSAIEANRENPTSWKTIQYLARIKRVGGIDPQALLREGGTGPLTERYLRQNVGHVQGGYGYDQTPAWANKPSGRLVLQFQKWGTQAADTFVKNVANPAVQAISLGKVGKKETVEVPTPEGGYRTVQVPGNILPAARFLLLATAAGLTQKELQKFFFGIEDKEASFAEILSRIEKKDAGAFGDLLHKVFMAQISVGAAGIIGNYAQLGVDITNRTRFKDITAPPGLVIPKAVTQLIIDGFSQGKLTSRDFDKFFTNVVSGYRTTKGMTSRLNDVAGGNILPLSALKAQNDLSWLRAQTRRYDNTLGVQPPGTFSATTIGKTPLTPFNADLKEALMLGDSLRVQTLLDQHFEGKTDSQQKEEMVRIRSMVRASKPIRAGGGSSEAMETNFLKWADQHLPIMDNLRILEINQRYRDTAVEQGLMSEHDDDEQKAEDALQKIEDRNAFKED